MYTLVLPFFHLSYNPGSTLSINQNHYYVSLVPCKTVMTYHAQWNIHTISGFTKRCYIVLNSHMLNYFSDLETRVAAKPQALPFIYQ